MRLPSRRQLKKSLSRRLIYAPFLRLVVFNVWFRSAILCFLLLGVLLALALPKMWLATPDGFLPEIRISMLDRIQAWSLRRTAAKFTAAQQVDEAEHAWRAAIANNPGDVEMCRASLRNLMAAVPPDRKHLGTAFSRAMWVMRLTGTNAVDLSIASEILDLYDLPEYQMRLLGSHAGRLTPKQEVALVKALFQTGLVPQFLQRWKQLTAEQQQDPALALHYAAYQAGWGPAGTSAAGRQVLEKACSDPARKLLARRLQLLVSKQVQDARTYATSLDELEQSRMDRLGDHVGYWLLLMATGKREEALRLAEAYPHPPTTPGELLRLAEAYGKLGLNENVRRFFQRYATAFGYSTEIWIAYARVLLEDKAWDELRVSAVQMRQAPGVAEALAAYSYYLEGRAEAALGRVDNANQAFESAAKAKLESPALRLEVGKWLARYHYPRYARAILLPAETDFSKDADYWSTRLQVAVELKETDHVKRAAELLYAMQPNNAQFANSYAAVLLLTRQRPEEAIKLTMQLMTAFPDASASRINHSFALLMNRRESEALTLLRTIPEAALNTSDLNSYHLAFFEIHLALNDPELARPHSERLDLAQLFPEQRRRVEELRARLPKRDGVKP